MTDVVHAIVLKLLKTSMQLPMSFVTVQH